MAENKHPEKKHPEKKHGGSCYCGAVTFEITGKIRSVVYCHCGQCRKMSGPFMAATSAPNERFTLTKDEGLTWFPSSSEAERGFCGSCGSPLFWRETEADRISICVGALDNPDVLAEAGHIFVADKPGWYDLHDGLPQFDYSDDGTLRHEIHDPA